MPVPMTLLYLDLVMDPSMAPTCDAQLKRPQSGTVSETLTCLLALMPWMQESPALETVRTRFWEGEGIKASDKKLGRNIRMKIFGNKNRRWA